MDSDTRRRDMAGRQVTNWGSPALDVIEGSGHATRRLIAAAGHGAFARGVVPGVLRRRSGGHQRRRDYGTTWAPIAIGSAMGYVDLDGVPAFQGSIKPGGPLFDAVVVTDGRGYKFTLDGAGDRALFEHLLASVTISAATASPLDHVSSTFTSPLYDYSIAVDPAWTTTPATEVINSPKSTDENCCDQIAITGSDTTIRVSGDPLNGKSVDAYLARRPPERGGRHHGAVQLQGRGSQHMGAGGGRHPAWRRDDPLQLRRRLRQRRRPDVCVRVGALQTFDATKHLTFADFEQLLATVSFAGT